MSAIIQEGAKVPQEWADEFARLLALPPPDTLADDEWRSVLDGAGRFLDAWANRAHAMGWRAREVFGLDSTRPLTPGGRSAAAVFLAGSKVLALTASEIVMRKAGVTGRLYRNGAGLTWEPLP